jgi:hypothetical protein
MFVGGVTAQFVELVTRSAHVAPALATQRPVVRHHAQVGVTAQVPQEETAAHGSAQAPQSDGQEVQVSVLLQVPSPQRGAQAPQSDGQEVQVSVPLQVPSPQRGAQAPQSDGHEVQVSPLLQLLSPHDGPGGTSAGGRGTSTGGLPTSTPTGTSTGGVGTSMPAGITS